MTVVPDEESSEEHSQVYEEPFPIPRLMKISNPKPALVPKYTALVEEFNYDLFQLYFSLVNYHIKSYDLNPNQEFSPALETFCTAFDNEGDNEEGQSEGKKKLDPKRLAEPECVVGRNHVVRKFLLVCQKRFFELTAQPSLTKIAVLHNELFYASEVLRQHNPDQEMMNFCDMLMADTFDLYNAVIGDIINNQYWNAGKNVEELITDLLKKEILTIRNLNRETFQRMSSCAIQRALDKAPPGQAGKIRGWAKDNEIVFETDGK